MQIEGMEMMEGVGVHMEYPPLLPFLMFLEVINRYFENKLPYRFKNLWPSSM